MEVSGFFDYDVSRDERRELDMRVRMSPTDRDATPDGSVRVYVDDAGLGPDFRSRLHVVTEGGVDSVLAARRSVMAPAIGPDGQSVAFIEVFDDEGRSETRDRVWVARPGAPETMIYDGPVQAKGGGSALTWSPDGRRIAMNFGGRTVVMDAAELKPPLRDLRGADACWLDPDHLVLRRPNGGIEVRDLMSDAALELVADGMQPQCMRP